MQNIVCGHFVFLHVAIRWWKLTFSDKLSDPSSVYKAV